MKCYLLTISTKESCRILVKINNLCQNAIDNLQVPVDVNDKTSVVGGSL